ncbi:hypothetical protein CXQ84_31445 [Burkholderia pseudomallei]|nr:hypothetical protein CXQ84_31445 [Burkholderia pseudomallei]
MSRRPGAADAARRRKRAGARCFAAIAAHESKRSAAHACADVSFGDIAVSHSPSVAAHSNHS